MSSTFIIIIYYIYYKVVDSNIYTYRRIIVNFRITVDVVDLRKHKF